MADGTIERKDVISDDVFKGLETLENSLKKNVDLIDALTKKSIENSKQIATSTNQAIKNDTELIEIQKKSVQAQTAVYESQKKLIDARVKLSAEQKEQIRIQKLNEIANNTEAGAIERLRAQIKLLESERVKMTDVTGKNKDAYTKLISEIERLRAEELSLGTVQDKQKANIGNYKSHWDGLGNSIRQMTTEMPNFFMNARIGFMSVSNNLPQVAEQIKLLNERNRELKANGEKTTPVLLEIAKSTLSWNTALMLVISLVTVGGPKIIQWISNIGKSTDELKEKQEAYNKKVEENIKIAEELYEINKKNSESQLKNSQNNLDLETKLGVSKSEIAKNELKLAEEKLKLADKAFSTFQKESNWNELRNQQAKQYIVTLNDYIKREREKINEINNGIRIVKDGKKEEIELNIKEAETRVKAQSKAIELYNKYKQDVTNAIQEIATTDEQYHKASTEEAKKALDKNNKKYENAINYQIELYKTKFENIKEQTRNLTADEDAFFYNSIEKMKIGVQQSNLSELEKQKIINQFNDYQKKINDYELSFIKEKDEREKKSIQDRIKLQEEANKLTQDQLQNNVDVLIQQANQLESQDDMQQASFKELEAMRLKLENQKLIVEATQEEGTQKEKNLASLDKELTQITKKQKQKQNDLINDLANYASQVNDIITGVYGTQLNLIEGNEQRELEASARKRDTNIANGMAQTEAEKKYQDEQAAIKKKYAKEEYEIKRKQAIWDKAYALVQIATQTAIAMIAAWKENSVMAIIKEGLIIAAAAASSALVLSNPIPKAPEYWKGTDYHPGGLAKVGDRYGRELVTLPSGKQFITPDTETIMDLPKGTKVDTNAKLKRMLSGLNSNESHEQNTINEQLLKELISTTKNKKMLKVDINEKGLYVLADSGQIRTRFINNRYRD